jgi:SagB-type dehydrogenase family enzyme
VGRREYGEWREYHEFTKHTVEKLRRSRHYLDWANMPNPYRHYEGVPLLDLPADPPAPQIAALEVLEGKLGDTFASDATQNAAAADVVARDAAAKDGAENAVANDGANIILSKDGAKNAPLKDGAENSVAKHEAVSAVTKDSAKNTAPRDVSANAVARAGSENAIAKDGAAFLSQLMFYSASISAIKRAAASTYALRVNPSSGNLHPTEFHFCTRGLVEWPDGLYHYRPSSHVAEQRAIGDFVSKLTDTDAPLAFVLTSIAWREAWKYRDRAYRYCLHDIGHAWQALALAGRAMGCESFAIGNFADDEISARCLLNEDEWPMLIITLQGPSIPVVSRQLPNPVLHRGEANQLSDEKISYPRIEKVHAATKILSATKELDDSSSCADTLKMNESGGVELPSPLLTSNGFGEVVRTRRSALDFRGGDEFMSLPQLSTLLSATGKPFFADFAAHRFVELYFYVHRVNGLEPGVYRYWPVHARIQQIKPGDQRLVAAALSLGQDLAGNSCVTFSMIGDFEKATQMYGDRGYRYVHFEAGAIGQRMYLAAEALGLRATGIGAFFDDEVHRYLSLTPEQGQVVYHFAVGYPVPDPRLEA